MAGQKLCLRDEPLSNLDAKLRDQVRIEIRRIQQEYGLTAIYVTHDQAEALAMSDRIVVLNGGRVEQVASPEQLYHAPKTKFVADFIGDANIFKGTVLGQTAAGHWQVETAIGTFDVAKSDTPPSKEIELCWRPESAAIGTSGITAKVLHRAFQGHFTDLMVETNGTTFRVQSKRVAAQEGDTIHIAVSPDDIILLDQS